MIEFLELGKSFIRDPARLAEDPVEKAKLQANLKKLHKRLEHAREKEVAQEIARLGLELCPADEAATYRNQKKKQLVAEQKAEEKRKAKADKAQEQLNQMKNSMAFDYKKVFEKPPAPKKDASLSDPVSFLAKYGLGDAFEDKQ